MGRRVDIDHLVDAHDVAKILGLKHRNTVSEYLTKYQDMPRPVIDLGRGRPMLWLRPEIERWASRRAASGQARPRRQRRSSN
jgi:glutathione-regulated potassium-efflux system ancillary protein KefG